MPENPSSPIFDARLRRVLEGFAVDPTDVPAFRTLEEHLFLAGAWSQLAGVYECRVAALAESDPERVALLLRLGRLLEERLGDGPAARRRYEEILRAQSQHAEALAALRQLHTRSGELAAALQIIEIEESLRLRPREAAAIRAEAGELWLSIGDIGEARKRFAQALRIDPGCDAALAGTARLAEAEGRPKEAIRLLERRLEGLSGPGRTDIMEHLAALLPETQADRKRKLLREVVLEDSKRKGSIELLIELEREHASWDLVDELQRKLWKLLDRSAQARLAQEAATLQLDEAENIESALYWAARADEVAGGDSAVQQLRARVFRRAGQTAGLIDALERSIALDGPSAMLTLELAALLERDGQAEQASTLLQDHLARQPDDLEALSLLDRCLARLCHYAERAEILERRITLATDPAEAAELCTELGDLWAGALDDPGRAEWSYRNALERLPAHIQASERLQALLRKAERFHDLETFLREFAAVIEVGTARSLAQCELGTVRFDKLADPDG
jgi:tetratricopeptide (TPR) repeat protein